MSSPFSNPSAWDRLVLQGPGGKVVLEAPQVSARGEVQEQSVPGQTTTILAYSPREVVVEARVWREEQWREVKRLLDLWRPKGQNPKPAPLTAVHPQLELLKLERVYLWSVELQPYTANEGYRLRLTLREWWPQKVEKPKSAQAIEGSGGVVGQGTPLNFDTAIGGGP